METLTVSKFKATCLAVLEEVHRKKKRILITKRGKPIAEVVPPGGQDQKTPLRETLTHLGDVVSPVASDEWSATSGMLKMPLLTSDRRILDFPQAEALW